jgi:hypothetical protein
VTDPRDLGGTFSGGDDPFGQGDVLIDARHAILAEHLDVCKVDRERGARGQDAYAVIVSGRINQTQDRARVMFFGDLDWLAALVTEIHGVIERSGVHDEFLALCDARWKAMPGGQ